VSRADELDPMGIGEDALCFAGTASAIIRELEAERAALLAIVRADSRCDFAQAASLIAALPEALRKEVQGA
jgi:hypothetical protein